MASPKLNVALKEDVWRPRGMLDETRRWTFTTEHDYDVYSGVLEIEKLPETSTVRRFLNVCPKDISLNFNEGNYTTKITDKAILLILGIEHIGGSVEILLQPGEEKTLERSNRILEDKLKKLKDELDELRGTTVEHEDETILGTKTSFTFLFTPNNSSYSYQVKNFALTIEKLLEYHQFLLDIGDPRYKQYISAQDVDVKSKNYPDPVLYKISSYMNIYSDTDCMKWFGGERYNSLSTDKDFGGSYLNITRDMRIMKNYLNVYLTYLSKVKKYDIKSYTLVKKGEDVRSKNENNCSISQYTVTVIIRYKIIAGNFYYKYFIDELERHPLETGIPEFVAHCIHQEMEGNRKVTQLIRCKITN